MMNLTCAILHADRQVSEQLEVFIAKIPFLCVESTVIPLKH